MSKAGRFIRACAVAGCMAVAIGGASAGAASAATFYVNGATGEDTNTCETLEAPCRTIQAAVGRSEEAPGDGTIEVAPGTYREEVELRTAADDGLTINGVAGQTIVEGPEVAKSTAIAASTFGQRITISNLTVNEPAENASSAIESTAELTLDNVTVEDHSPQATAIESLIGSTKLNGCHITMAAGTTDNAIVTIFSNLSVNDSTVTLQEGAEGGGIGAQEIFFGGNIEVSNTTISLPATAKQAAIEGLAGIVSLSGVTIDDASREAQAGGLFVFLPSSLSASHVHITMSNPASTAPAVGEEGGGPTTFDHLEVDGAWGGEPLVVDLAPVTLRDSRLMTAPGVQRPAAEVLDDGGGYSLLVQRSVLESFSTTTPALLVRDTDATIDSSLILGGGEGVLLAQEDAKALHLTIAASTIDPGAPGAGEEGEAAGVSVVAAKKPAIANVNIEGSIVLDPQESTIEVPGAQANITCSDSDVPSQTQTANAPEHEGSIACASGTGGNVSSPSLVSPLIGSIAEYTPLPGSAAIDGVPASAISLPSGIAPSTTDLTGEPRTRLAQIGANCVAMQDMGAIELQSNPSPCPAPTPAPAPACALGSAAGCPPSPRPAPAPTISNLRLFPASFLPGSPTDKRGKRGTTVRYTDSLAARTRFTIFALIPGRMSAGHCRRLTSRARHARRCFRRVSVTSFVHVDVAGSNQFFLSGVFGGKALQPGAYALRAVPWVGVRHGAARVSDFDVNG